MPFDSRQIRLVLLVLVAVMAVLSLLWFALLRTVYVPVYQNIRESDASAIVAVLDAAGIPYQLANQGHDILVPEGEESAARVAVAGSEISIGGTVGFELFNDSDMGLTEFAQKINFQRAMQGELARTIMMMDGVEFARVHLALPERSIFRAADEAPTAAVSIEMQPGSRLSPQRIGGIQQLVASSVPSLSTFDVAILDENGDLVSTAAQPADAVAGEPASERSALESFYGVKARKAIADILPGMRFDIELAARPAIVPPPAAEADGAEAAVSETPGPARAMPGRDDLALGVVVRTPQTLAAEERAAIEAALRGELGLSEPRGDTLVFSTGALTQAVAGANPAPMTDIADPATQAEAQPAEWEWGNAAAGFFDSRWSWLVLALLGIALMVIWPRRRLAKDDVATFADMLKSAAQDRKGAAGV